MRKTKLNLTLFVILSPIFIMAQTEYVINISGTKSDIQIDGIEEEEWRNVKSISEFWLNAPIDGVRAESTTEVKMLYNEDYVFIFATCYDNPNYIITTLKRDQFGDDDSFGVLLDPINQKANGYGFGVNALGAETETLLAGDDADDSWNNKWIVKTKQYDNRWTAEIAIPFKTLRFEEDNDQWGINFVRVEPGSNETHVWAPVPRQFNFYDMGYYGTLQWDKPPENAGKNIAFIPYTSIGQQKSYNPYLPSERNIEVGIDAKVAITPSLNLDLTTNPDFSQIEVDDQVTNLTRFSIFFPEKRQFFLENGDIFNGFGILGNSPFYSRRIGLDPSGRSIPILYGARLTGNVSEKSRIGVLNMHTATQENSFGQDYSALAVQHRIGERSSVSGLFLNRQAFDGTERIGSEYGRNAGGQINLSTKDGKWSGLGGYLHSFKEEFKNKNQHVYGFLNFAGRRFRTFLGVHHMGENYFADIGFNGRLFNFNPSTGKVVRIGFTQIASNLDYYIYPENSGSVNFHWSGVENYVYINDGGYGLNEWYTRLRHFIFFKNTSQIRFRLNHNYVDLVFPFPITEIPLPVKSYSMLEFNIQYFTDQRKVMNGEIFAIYGQFYNGTKLTYNLDANFRIQPWGSLSVGLEQNFIRLPEPYGNLDLTLATAKVEINFSTTLFWTTFAQYNKQGDNFNINSRLQWRAAPMSDIFLVYTDDYLIEGGLGPKNRSVVMKASYWLGL